MGGHIDAVAIAPIEVKSGVDAGKLTVIAVMGEERSEAFPEVPTLIESGVDFSLIHWGGVIAPKDLPADVEAKLTAALQAAVESEEFASFLEERAMQAQFTTGEEAMELVQSNYDYFATAIPEATDGAQ